MQQLKSQLAVATSLGPPAKGLEGPVCAPVDNCGQTPSQSPRSEAGPEGLPDATDGVGTIEFANGEEWAYFGTIILSPIRLCQDFRV